MTRNRATVFGAAGLALAGVLALAGCPGGGTGRDFGSPEGKAIADQLDGLVEDKGRKEKYQLYFVKGVEPKGADVKKFASHEYQLVGTPSISGDTATARIEVRKEDTRDTVGQVEWTFAREGNAWKIKTYPVP
jgi:hypothetical protein